MHVRFNCKILPLVGLFMIVGGCTTAVVLTDHVELARSAITRAVAADATQYAPVEMRAAQDKLSALDRALGEKRFDQVRVLAQQAEVDGRLAETKARAQKTQDLLKIEEQGIEVLKHEMLGESDAAPTQPGQ